MSNKLSRYIMTLVALFAMTTGAWAQTVGTLLTSTDGKVWTLDKMPAGDVELQVEYEPEFTATFIAKNAYTIESGQATVSVKDGEAAAVAAKLEGEALKGLYEGQTVILTAKQGYKFRSVEATKAGARQTLTVGDVTLDITGCTTWQDVVDKNSDKIEAWYNATVYLVKKKEVFQLLQDNKSYSVETTQNVDPKINYSWASLF